MWILWRVLPICVVGIALWRLIPAVGSGFGSMRGGNAITQLNAAKIANALQGELGAAAQGGGPSMDDGLFGGSARSGHVDAWNRPFEIREDRDTIEVVSCGEDGMCGTKDDIIEMVRKDGTRQRLDGRDLKPKEPEKKPGQKAPVKLIGRPIKKGGG